MNEETRCVDDYLQLFPASSATSRTNTAITKQKEIIWRVEMERKTHCEFT